MLLAERFIHIGFFAPALPLLTHLTPKLSPRSYQQILSLPAFSLSLFVALLQLMLLLFNLYCFAALALHTAVGLTPIQ